MDKLEPIRQVFRNAGLYHHAADDLLCGELLRAAASEGIARGIESAIAADADIAIARATGETTKENAP